MTLKTVSFRNNIHIENKQEREVKIMIILLSVFIGAIILGVSLAQNNLVFLRNIYFSFYDIDFSFGIIFGNTLIVNLLLFSIVVISGFSIIGCPSVIAVLLLKGFSIGCVCLVLLTEYGLSGIGLYLLIIFPSNIISVVLLLLASEFSIAQSFDIISVIYDRNKEIKIQFRRILYKNMILTFIMIISSLSESLLFMIFGKLFDI